jgi:transcriptional regulator with XRE-family HTH domain
VGGTDKGRSDRQAELGDRIRKYRQRLGLSQEALALQADINRSYIASLEAGRRNPSLDMLARLAMALQIDLGTLIRGLQDLRGRG